MVKIRTPNYKKPFKGRTNTSYVPKPDDEIKKKKKKKKK
jgi:hypothetical protein